MTQLVAPMDCRNFRKHHLSYLDDTLSGDQMAAAQRHILACDRCAAHDTMVRRSLMVARSMPSIEPSTGFQERLQARLAECRQERVAQESAPDARAGSDRRAADRRRDIELMPFPGYQSGWRSPRMMVAIAASAVIGVLVWRGALPEEAPLIAMEPVIATEPVRPEIRYVSPALLQAMATGSPIWPAAVLIDEMPSPFVNVDYSMMLDGRP
ncbi:MAG: hypothetical protein IPP90_12700 [Gemmatimonadaceae bacterium]|nr:hypothetical protein [Gemmatimonadaceae bacterium]